MTRFRLMLPKCATSLPSTFPSRSLCRLKSHTENTFQGTEKRTIKKTKQKKFHWKTSFVRNTIWVIYDRPCRSVDTIKVKIMVVNSIKHLPSRLTIPAAFCLLRLVWIITVSITWSDINKLCSDIKIKHRKRRRTGLNSSVTKSGRKEIQKWSIRKQSGLRKVESGPIYEWKMLLIFLRSRSNKVMRKCQLLTYFSIINFKFLETVKFSLNFVQSSTVS